MSDCLNPSCKEKDLHPVTARSYDGCCSPLCEEIVDHERTCDILEETESKLADAIDEIEELVKAIDHGNGKVILNWMDAHRKAMDRLEETEKKLRFALIKNEKAYRAGYRDGATAVNTVGPDALDHVEMHLERWKNERT